MGLSQNTREREKKTVFPGKNRLALKIVGANPTLMHLTGNVFLASFCPDGFVGIGVSVGTDVFVHKFVGKTCRVIMDDVEILFY